MRKVLLLVISVMLLGIFEACVPAHAVEKSKIEKSLFISIKGVKKDIIFEKTKQWIASNFRSAKAVIEYDNKEEGTIIGNTILSTVCEPIPLNTISNCNYIVSMRVDIKDEKIRIKFFNVQYSAYINNQKYEGELSDKTYDEYENQITSLVNSLTNYIKNTNKNSNW